MFLGPIPTRSHGSELFGMHPLLARLRELTPHRTEYPDNTFLSTHQHKDPGCTMSENPLVVLADAMRNALSTSLETKDKAGQAARLDLIDMIPDLQRILIGEQAFIRNMTWSVNMFFTIRKSLANGILEAFESCNFTSYQ